MELDCRLTTLNVDPLRLGQFDDISLWSPKMTYKQLAVDRFRISRNYFSSALDTKSLACDQFLEKMDVAQPVHANIQPLRSTQHWDKLQDMVTIVVRVPC